MRARRAPLRLNLVKTPPSPLLAHLQHNVQPLSRPTCDTHPSRPTRSRLCAPGLHGRNRKPVRLPALGASGGVYALNKAANRRKAGRADWQYFQDPRGKDRAKEG